MSRKQFVTVLILLVALGGAALLLRSRSTSSWSETATGAGGKVLDFPLNDVSHVSIKGGGGELNVVKSADIWKVAERFQYPADFDKVATLLRKLWELRAAQEVKAGTSQFSRLQLTPPTSDPNSGLLVDLIGNNHKRLAALLLGKKYLRESNEAPGGGFPAGRYVAPQDGSNRVFLVSDTFEEIQTKPEQWLSREFITIQKPKLIAITGPAPAMNWKLVRENESAAWKFADPMPGEEIDNSKATSVANILASPTFVDVLDPKTPPNQSGLDRPATAHVETFENFVYDLRIGKLTGENYPTLITVSAHLPGERTPTKDEKPEQKANLDQQFQSQQKQLTDRLEKEKKLENWPYLISRNTIEQLIKDRTALLAEKKTASPAPQPPGPSAPAPPPKGSKTTPRPHPPGRPR
jgi:hypothetical protein